ncbi:MAG: aldolase/citrate lyase family protein [Verrucomicrobiota bacterium]|nr:aldolase/citrate lyase family protein [Verrucomicrobiota bacterium]
MFRPSKVLAKIRAGQVARVCSVGSPLAYFPQMAAHFGYDAVWVDAEHRAWEARDVREMILRHHLADIDCVFRPATLERAGLSRLLEDGATALMIPLVNTPERARHLVEATRFPPLGERGLDGSGLDAKFWVKKLPDYPQQANRETALIVQIETPLALENADAIAAVEGVDVVFIGPGDLSLRLGCAPSLQETELRAALERVAAACKKHGKAWGMPVGSIEDARTLIGLGAQLINFGSEFFGVFKQLESCAAQWNELLGHA